MALQPYASNAAGTMHGALVPIAKYTTPAGGGTGYELAFTSIPQGYRDLMIVWNTRGTAATLQGFPYLRLNDDASALYSDTNLSGDGAAVTTSRSTSATLGRVGAEPAAYAAPNRFGAIVTHIMNYANTSVFKTVLSRSASDINSGTQGSVTRFTNFLYRSTSGITSIRISDESGGVFVGGSTIVLYGVRSIGQ
jgi:hypothetical protein